MSLTPQTQHSWWTKCSRKEAPHPSPKMNIKLSCFWESEIFWLSPSALALEILGSMESLFSQSPKKQSPTWASLIMFLVPMTALPQGKFKDHSIFRSCSTQSQSVCLKSIQWQTLYKLAISKFLVLETKLSSQMNWGMIFTFLKFLKHNFHSRICKMIFS